MWKMGSLLNKFQEAVKVLAKSPTFAKEPRHLQFEADINRLFLYTSYKFLGKDATEADADEIIELATKASFPDQQKQVQENIHSQMETFCSTMDDILLPDTKTSAESHDLGTEKNSSSHRSGLSLAIGQTTPTIHVPETKPLSRLEVSQKLKDLLGYTLEVKESGVPHKDAGKGLFISGEADVGTAIAFYPGVAYSPAHYRYIPGYPKVDAQNTYLITRYDGAIINAQPWGIGADSRVLWNGSGGFEPTPNIKGADKGSDKMWKMLSKPLDGSKVIKGEILERRNPLALAHFANHPGRDTIPNVMVCSYDFPLTEDNMRAYIPNISFGNYGEEAKMRKFGSFWFKSWKSASIGTGTRWTPVLKALVLVATRSLCDEEVFLNYRLSNTNQRPEWYTPVDEEEDRRRWG